MSARRRAAIPLGGLLTLLLVAAAAATAAVAPTRGGGSGVVATDGRVGKLRIDVSTAADIRRVAGRPAYSGVGTFRPLVPSIHRFLALGYRCHRTPGAGIPTLRHHADGSSVLSGVDCATVYYIEEVTGALSLFVTRSAAFRTRLGTRPGMPWSRVREHGLTYENCGGLFVHGADATLTVTNAGGHEPSGSPPGPISGGHVFTLELESAHPRLDLECPGW